MDTYDIEEAEARLIELIEGAAEGHAFVIAKGGKPLVKVVPVEPAAEAQAGPARSRIGFLKGRLDVPDDFKEIGREEIERMFYGDPEK